MSSSVNKRDSKVMTNMNDEPNPIFAKNVTMTAINYINDFFFFFFKSSAPPQNLPSSPTRPSPVLRMVEEAAIHIEGPRHRAGGEPSRARERHVQRRELVAIAPPILQDLHGARHPTRRRDPQIGRAHV